MKEDVTADAELDCVGLFCPLPIARTKEEIENIEVGQILKVEADDPAAEEDVSRWAKRVGHEVVKLEKSGGYVQTSGLETPERLYAPFILVRLPELWRLRLLSFS